MKRRRPVGRNIYTVTYLLDKQPKSLCRQKHYQLMVSYLQNAPQLRGIRFNQRCYSLLNEAVIKPEHLDHFYRTYRLPKTPFFPLFFMIKRNYLMERENKKLERKMYIEVKMNSIPSYVQRFFALILQFEQKYNRAGNHPVYKENLSVTTKKRSEKFATYEHADWIDFFRMYNCSLRKRYERIPLENIDRIFAYFILNCIPSSLAVNPDSTKINNRYRNYSKIYHPDRGGDPELFIKIKWARDLLLKKA